MLDGVTIRPTSPHVCLLQEEVQRRRAAAESIVETRDELMTAEFEFREKQTLHDGHKEHSTTVGDEATTALRAQLAEEKAKLARLLARQVPVVQQNRMLAALDKHRSRASAAGQAGTSGRG